ncbi:hypothetical protein, partial [Heyndrickxia coagulans]|uniref:hypothetical protein n=1 Tax=Heyndrickxia coagulans TaxID=1398 RepID=UPI003D2101E3
MLSFGSRCHKKTPPFFQTVLFKVVLHNSELPSTYQPYGLIEVGASRLIVAFTSQRKLTELTLLFQEFCYEIHLPPTHWCDS